MPAEEVSEACDRDAPPSLQDYRAACRQSVGYNDPFVVKQYVPVQISPFFIFFCPSFRPSFLATNYVQAHDVDDVLPEQTALEAGCQSLLDTYFSSHFKWPCKLFRHVTIAHVISCQTRNVLEMLDFTQQTQSVLFQAQVIPDVGQAEEAPEVVCQTRVPNF